MPKWFKKNLTPFLAALAATLYFFGQQLSDYKHYFQHIETLIPKSSYPELITVSVKPLFGYVAWAWFTISSGILVLLLMQSRTQNPYASMHSQSGAADTRSMNGIKYLKHGKPFSRKGWDRFSWQKGDLRRLVFILLLFLMSWTQKGIENSLTNNGDLLLQPKSANFSILWRTSDVDTFLIEAYIWLILMFLALPAFVYLYVTERTALSFPVLWKINFRTWIAIAFALAFLNCLHMWAYFGGFLYASSAREISSDSVQEPALKGRRLFLLDQSSDSYALLTSRLPTDERTIMFVKKDRLPVLEFKETVNIYHRLDTKPRIPWNSNSRHLHMTN